MNFSPLARPRTGSSNILLFLVWLILLVFVGAGSYFVVSKFVARPAPTTEPTSPATTAAPTMPEVVVPTPPTEDPAAREKAEEAARREADRLRLEEEKQKQEEAKRLAEQKEKERLEQQAREEKRKKEEQARLAAEKLAALKRNPPTSAALEEIEAQPDKYAGQYLTVDRVAIKLQAIERSKELGRFTLGVTSERGKYYSRVPLSGLLVSSSDKLGAMMQKLIDGTDNFYRYKLFCEVRKWGKKEGAATWPEVHVYKVEAYDRMGKLTKVMEE